MLCDQIQNMINDYYDDLLSEDDRIEIDRHLGTCFHCSVSYQEMNNYFEQLKNFSMSIEKPTGLLKDINAELTGEKPPEQTKSPKSLFGFFKKKS